MKKLVAVLTLALIALGGYAIHQRRQLGAERHLNADLQERVKALEARPSFAPVFTPPAQPAVATAEPKATAAPPVDAAAARAQREQAQAAAQSAMANARGMLATPEGQQAMSGMIKAMLPMAMPDLAKELNLNPAELDKLLDVFAKQAGGVMDVMGGGASPQDMAGRAREMEQANDAQIAALLGDKYPLWKEYEEQLPMRLQVNQLQTTLAASNNKLSDSQTRPLIAALSAEQKRINQEGISTAAVTPGTTPQERRQQLNAANNQRMVNAASPYMTAVQLDAYKALLEQQNAMRGTFGGMGGMGGLALPLPLPQ